MRKNASSTGVGSSSIMLIIVVVCLTLFGVLSFVTARHDALLTDRMFKSVQGYYAADAAAQRTLMAVDEWIQRDMRGQPMGAELCDNGDGTLSFSVSAEDTRELHVVLRVIGKAYRIERYSYESNIRLPEDTTLNLYW